MQFSELKNDKLCSMQELLPHRKQYQSLGHKVILTNGCFDLLHAGHIYFLQTAAQMGQVLFVLLNSDQSVQALKGVQRPIIPQLERAYCLAALPYVDRIALFNTPRLDQEILDLSPDIYVKAGDYSRETLDPDERRALETCKAEICFLPHLDGISTSRIIEKMPQT